MELAEWNPSNGPQARSDTTAEDSNIVGTFEVGTKLSGADSNAQPEQKQRQLEVKETPVRLQGDDKEAIVKASVSVETVAQSRSSKSSSELTHKGTVEDLLEIH